MTTLTIGQVLLQVFSTNFILADTGQFRPTMPTRRSPTPQALSRIRPVGRSRLRWPPSTYVSPDVLDKVANWGQPTTQPS